MNEEQAKSAIRWFIQTFGGAIAGWFAAKGYFTIGEFLNVINSPTVIAGAAAVVAGGWGIFNHTKTNAIAVAGAIAADPAATGTDEIKQALVTAVDAIPEVSGVVTKQSIDGRALADATPSTTVVVAGTPAATKVATANPSIRNPPC